jgi:hypothetical protein
VMATLGAGPLSITFSRLIILVAPRTSPSGSSASAAWTRSGL